MEPIKIRVELTPAKDFTDIFSDVGARFAEAVSQTVEMIRSMLEAEAKADIASAPGRFASWTSGLHVISEGSLAMYVISMTHDRPYAGIFETGGTNTGNMWIPFSGTDAEGIRPREYRNGLFSAVSSSGRPLLFSLADKLPRYFMATSVTIPPKFHLNADVRSVMSNFAQAFEDRFGGVI